MVEKDYLNACEEDVKTLSKIHAGYWKEPRYGFLKEFCKSGGKIISVGCAVNEPILIGATHAIDITPTSEKYLRDGGWLGEFKVASCDNLPYEDKSFDIVICSEVIEHLPNLEMVKKTFLEVERVGKKWMITTPNTNVIKKIHQNKSHLQFFTPETIKEIIPVKYEMFTHDHHIYMRGGEIG